MTTLTRDSIAIRGAGVVTVTQPPKGFRFTLDSILLADFCRIKPKNRILEAGCGTGVISLLLARKFPQSRITAVEIHASSAALCRANVIDNDLQDHITVLEEDIGRLHRVLTAETFDVVVANPPYTQSSAGRESPDQSRQTARHEQKASLGSWLDMTSRLLKNRGACFLVFPATRTADIAVALKSRRLEPKRIRCVHPNELKSASLILIEAIKAGGTGLEVLPPLFVHEQNGAYTEEMHRIYGPQES